MQKFGYCSVLLVLGDALIVLTFLETGNVKIPKLTFFSSLFTLLPKKYLGNFVVHERLFCHTLLEVLFIYKFLSLPSLQYFTFKVAPCTMN